MACGVRAYICWKLCAAVKHICFPAHPSESPRTFVCVVISMRPPSSSQRLLGEKSLLGIPIVSIVSWMDSVLVGIIGEANGCKLLARADKETALYIFELAFWHDRIPGTHWFLGSLLVSNQHRMNWWYQTSFGPYKLWCVLRPSKSVHILARSWGILVLIRYDSHWTSSVMYWVFCSKYNENFPVHFFLYFLW